MQFLNQFGKSSSKNEKSGSKKKHDKESEAATASRATPDDKYAFGRPHGISISQPLNPQHVAHIGLGTDLSSSTLASISQLPSPRQPSPHGTHSQPAGPQTSAIPSAPIGQPTPVNADGAPIALDPDMALLTKGPGSHIPLENVPEDDIKAMFEEMMVCFLFCFYYYILLMRFLPL